MTQDLREADGIGSDSIDDVARLILGGNAPAKCHVPGITGAHVHYAALGLSDWLCRIPPEEQERWTVHVPRDPAADEPDDGVIFRRTGAPSDQKVFLHVRADLIENLLEVNGIAVEEPWLSWLLACDLLRRKCVSAAERLAARFDRMMPELRMVERLRQAEIGAHSSVLRILQYEESASGFAKPHVDRNGLSFALGASDERLFFLRGNERYRPGRPGNEQAIVFPGVQFEKASGSRVPACVHGSDAAAGPGNRWAVVCFVYLAQ